MFVFLGRVQEFRRFSEKSDVYAFGVFLLELVSGREASEPSPSSSTQTLVEWVMYYVITENVDNEVYSESHLLICRCKT